MRRSGSYLGQTLRRRCGRGYMLVETRYEQKAALPMHRHRSAHFCLVLDGAYREEIGSRWFARIPGTLVYYPAMVEHAELHYVSGRHFLIDLEPDWHAASGLGLTSDVVQLPVGAPTDIASRICGRFRTEDVSEREIKQSLRTLLLLTNRHGVRNSVFWLDRVQTLLPQAAANHWSLTKLADQVNVHPAHLARSFRSSFGCTIGAQVRRIRVDEASRKILGSCKSLADIADETGFADQSHLCREIKLATGLTPLQLRNAAQAC